MEFDSKEVIEFVQSVLAEQSFQPERRTVPLAYNEGRLLEVLSLRLKDYIPQADISMLLDELRGELYSGIDMGTTKYLHSITKGCHKCPAALPEPQLPQWNKTDPDIIFINDLPLNKSDLIDTFVIAVKKAKLNSNRIMLTYVNRCVFGRRANLDEIHNCVGYLHHELQLLKPKLIVPLGLIPTAALMGTDIKIGEERGRICWLGPWAIMPTYSPAYVNQGGPNFRSTFEQDLIQAHNFTYGVI